MKLVHVFIGLKIAEVAAVVFIPYLTGVVLGHFGGGTWGEPVWFSKWVVGIIIDSILFCAVWFLYTVVGGMLSDLVKWNWRLARRLSK